MSYCFRLKKKKSIFQKYYQIPCTQKDFLIRPVSSVTNLINIVKQLTAISKGLRERLIISFMFLCF